VALLFVLIYAALLLVLCRLAGNWLWMRGMLLRVLLGLLEFILMERLVFDVCIRTRSS
jgi:hypothetical protein